MPDTETLPEAERIRRLEITVGHVADGFHPRISDAETAVLALVGRLDRLQEGQAGHIDRIRNVERTIAEDHLALGALLDRVDYLEAQTRDAETDRYVELRRIIKVIGLTEILNEADAIANRAVDVMSGYDWQHFCAELYRRYGHLQFDGKPLWSKPPTVSDQTKTMIVESLKRRQEA